MGTYSLPPRVLVRAFCLRFVRSNKFHPAISPDCEKISNALAIFLLAKGFLGEINNLCNEDKMHSGRFVLTIPGVSDVVPQRITRSLLKVSFWAWPMNSYSLWSYLLQWSKESQAGCIVLKEKTHVESFQHTDICSLSIRWMKWRTQGNTRDQPAFTREHLCQSLHRLGSWVMTACETQQKAVETHFLPL